MKNASITDMRLGTDLVHIPRLRAAYQRFDKRFLRRLLTDAERDYCKGDIQKVSGRIAVKEAVSKALGTGMQGLGWSAGTGWREIEVISVLNETPQLKLHGKAQDYADELGISDWRITLSHDGDYATATVIGLIRD